MFLKSTNLAKCPELIHGFTTRELGDDYDRIAGALGVSAEAIITLNQVHSDRVVVLTPSPQPSPLKGEGARENPPPLRGGGQGEGDAIVTQQKGLIIGIRTADCVPILIYDPDHRIVAAVHAGWRGLIAGIIENSIRMMREKFLTDPKNLVVAMGAALCPGCFQIGPEVAGQFENRFGARLTITKGEGDRSYLDLRKAGELVLNDLGVAEENIEVLPHCTACQPDLFYSYRRGDRNGRMLGFIGLID